MDDHGDAPTGEEIRRALAECMTLTDIDDAMGWRPGTAGRRRWRTPPGLPPADAQLGGVALWFRSTIACWREQVDPRRGRVRAPDEDVAGPLARPPDIDPPPDAADADAAGVDTTGPDGPDEGSENDGSDGGADGGADDAGTGTDEPTGDDADEDADAGAQSVLAPAGHDEERRADAPTSHGERRADAPTSHGERAEAAAATDVDAGAASTATGPAPRRRRDTPPVPAAGEEPAPTPPPDLAPGAEPGGPAVGSGFDLGVGEPVYAYVHRAWRPAVVHSRARSTVGIGYRLGRGKLDERRQRVSVDRIRRVAPT